MPKLTIFLIGANGTLGKAIATELGGRHKIISGGRKSGDVQLDISQPQSIEEAFKKIGPVDAVVSAAGEVKFLPLSEISPAQFGTSAYTLGLENKLLGQVNLALVARNYLRENGSITLTSGILGDQPIAAGSSASMVNGALHSFVIAAAVELPKGIRINAVSPNVFVESLDSYGPFFRGFEAVRVARAALAFSRSVEGLQTGQVYKVY